MWGGEKVEQFLGLFPIKAAHIFALVHVDKCNVFPLGQSRLVSFHTYHLLVQISTQSHDCVLTEGKSLVKCPWISTIQNQAWSRICINLEPAPGRIENSLPHTEESYNWF